MDQDKKNNIADQLRRLHRLMRRDAYRQHHEGKMHDPHRGQGRILAILNMKPEITQRELHYLLNMSKQALAEMLAKLEGQGLITREVSEADRRVLTIKMTEEGKAVSAATVAHERDESKFFACLNDAELETLSTLIDKLVANAKTMVQEDDSERTFQRGVHGHRRMEHGHGHSCPPRGDKHRRPGRAVKIIVE